MAPTEKVKCPCGCGKTVSLDTERRHRKNKASATLQASAAAKGKGRLASLLTSDLRTGANLSARSRVKFTPPMPPETCSSSSVLTTIASESTGGAVQDSDTMDIDEFDDAGNPASPRQECADKILDSARESVQARVWAGRTRRSAYVEDAEDEDEDDTQLPQGDSSGSEDGSADNSDSESSEDGSAWYEQEAYSSRATLSEEFLHRAHLHGIELSDEDLSYMRPFALRTDTHLKGAVFDKLQYAFPTTSVPTWKQCQARAASLSGFKPQQFDCCVDSCCCFTGAHSDLRQCPYCHASRYDAENRPRQTFTYLPIIPRLKAFIANSELARKLRYRAHEHVRKPGTISDVFDSLAYQSLLGRKVTIGGKEMSWKHFSDLRDFALGLSTDGFAPFRRRKQTCWPIILFNYNLPPEIRFHIEYILSVGVVPGPKKPVDFDSFLWPLVQELLQLALGVHAYDSLSNTFFPLRAYLILVFGDIPAMSMVMRMKGHNGFRPCRMCNISGIRIPGSRQPTHYVPLDRSTHPDVRADDTATKAFDAEHLPLRDDFEFRRQANEVDTALNDTTAERLAKDYGIKGLPLLAALSSLSFPDSFPYDFMHLLWENVTKNLMLLWTGSYKGLDTGCEDYELPPTVWDAVGVASAECGATIPAALGPRTPNVASDKSMWTADSRSMWFLHVGPILLERRFTKPKYYKHFVALVKLINRCLQFEYSAEDIEFIRQGFVTWVMEYERIYYQHNPARLSACPVTIHALLHIAGSIVAAGPVWTSWAFPMERYCSALQPAITSRRFPYASIGRYLVDHTRLQLIRLLYSNAKESLDMHLQDRARQPNKNTVCITGYDNYLLLPKRSRIVLPSGVLDKVIGHLCTRFGATPTVIRRSLPLDFEQWACVQIKGDDEVVRAAALSRRSGEDNRDASYVRYKLDVDRNARFRNLESVFESRNFYGQVQNILVVPIPALPSVGVELPMTLILGIIRSCAIEDRHHSLNVHYYSRAGSLDVVDITTIKCLIGRVKEPCRGQWATIDRTSD